MEMQKKIVELSHLEFGDKSGIFEMYRKSNVYCFFHLDTT